MSQDHYASLIARVRMCCQQTIQDALSLGPNVFEELALESSTGFVFLGQDKLAGSVEKREDDTSWYISKRKAFVSLTKNSQGQFTFAFPPATDQQLIETEQQLGFPLPPLLRLLYQQIANGGFGPGRGIIGAIGGYWLNTGEVDIAWGYHQQIAQAERLINLTEMESSLRSHLSLHDQEKPNLKPYYLPALPQGTWPERLLPLCEWGCAISTYIDANTEHIFQSMGEGPFLYVAASLEEWLERWLAREDLQFL